VLKPSRKAQDSKFFLPKHLDTKIRNAISFFEPEGFKFQNPTFVETQMTLLVGIDLCRI